MDQNSKLSGDVRRIHRGIATLCADLGRPGRNDIFSAIDYIFGLFDVAAFVTVRRKEQCIFPTGFCPFSVIIGGYAASAALVAYQI